MHLLITAASAAGGYLVGSVPFSYLIVRWAKGIDIRKSGDGNVGASNVSRIAGGKAGTAAFLCDLVKGLAAVLLAKYVFRLSETDAVITGVCAIAGHNWPVFLGFKGGKGLSTTMGVVGTLAPVECAILLIPLFLLYLVLKRAIACVLIIGPILPVICLLTKRPPGIVIGTAAILALVYINGFENAKEAWAGLRGRFSKK